MKQCGNCHTPVTDEAAFCPGCGARFVAPGAYPPPTYTAQPVYDPYDHTGEFEAKDIADHKLYAMLAYLLDVFGVVIALLAAKDSPYTAFHVRQAVKLTVVEVLLTLAMVLLAWTVIAVIAYVVLIVILLVLRILAFCQVCGGKAKEPAMIRGLTFLR